jgi:hypothetical protein
VSGLLPPESGGLQETVPLLVCSRDQGRKSVENQEREREREREREICIFPIYIYIYIYKFHHSSIVGIYSFDQGIENTHEIGDNKTTLYLSLFPRLLLSPVLKAAMLYSHRI